MGLWPNQNSFIMKLFLELVEFGEREKKKKKKKEEEVKDMMLLID